MKLIVYVSVCFKIQLFYHCYHEPSNNCSGLFLEFVILTTVMEQTMKVPTAIFTVLIVSHAYTLLCLHTGLRGGACATMGLGSMKSRTLPSKSTAAVILVHCNTET
jgi:hypothetical protein